MSCFGLLCLESHEQCDLAIAVIPVPRVLRVIRTLQQVLQAEHFKSPPGKRPVVWPVLAGTGSAGSMHDCSSSCPLLFTIHFWIFCPPPPLNYVEDFFSFPTSFCPSTLPLPWKRKSKKLICTRCLHIKSCLKNISYNKWISNGKISHFGRNILGLPQYKYYILYIIYYI